MRFALPTLALASILVVGCADGDKRRTADLENQLEETRVAEMEMEMEANRIAEVERELVEGRIRKSREEQGRIRKLKEERLQERDQKWAEELERDSIRKLKEEQARIWKLKEEKAREQTLANDMERVRENHRRVHAMEQARIRKLKEDKEREKERIAKLEQTLLMEMKACIDALDFEGTLRVLSELRPIVEEADWLEMESAIVRMQGEVVGARARQAKILADQWRYSLDVNYSANANTLDAYERGYTTLKFEVKIFNRSRSELMRINSLCTLSFIINGYRYRLSGPTDAYGNYVSGSIHPGKSGTVFYSGTHKGPQGAPWRKTSTYDRVRYVFDATGSWHE
jgi:hypothetical protein